MDAFECLISTIMHNWFLQSRGRRRWGIFWNLDAIEFAKKCIAEYWEYNFGMPDTMGKLKFSACRRLVIIFTRPISWLMAKKSIISLQFWLAIWSGFYILNDESELQWRWTKSRAGDE